MGYELENVFFEHLVGLDANAVEQVLQQSLPDDFDLNIFRQLSAECWHSQVCAFGIPVMPGVNEVLFQVKRLGWLSVVATNSHQSQALKLLEIAGLGDEFTQVFTSDQVEKPKPSPDVYTLAAQSIFLQPWQCLVLEDSYTGVQAAIAAGMKCCWIPGTSAIYKDSVFDDCLVFDSLHDVALRLQKL
jgi:HAD superfamily hydrolase (TIGR01509 family)